jgi:streptogramin lyase
MSIKSKIYDALVQAVDESVNEYIDNKLQQHLRLSDHNNRDLGLPTYILKPQSTTICMDTDNAGNTYYSSSGYIYKIPVTKTEIDKVKLTTTSIRGIQCLTVTPDGSIIYIVTNKGIIYKLTNPSTNFEVLKNNASISIFNMFVDATNNLYYCYYDNDIAVSKIDKISSLSNNVSNNVSNIVTTTTTNADEHIDSFTIDRNSGNTLLYAIGKDIYYVNLSITPITRTLYHTIPDSIGISSITCLTYISRNIIYYIGQNDKLYVLKYETMINPIDVNNLDIFKMNFTNNTTMYYLSQANSINIVNVPLPTFTFATVVSGPIGLAFDTSDNLYCAKGGDNSGISKITQDGIVTQFAGIDFARDVAINSSGNIYCLTSMGTIKTINNGVISNLSLVPLTLNESLNLTFDNNNNLYCSNRYNTNNKSYSIVKKNSTGTVEFGNFSTAPAALAFDSNGNLYFSSISGQNITKISIVNGVIGSSTIIASNLGNIYGLAFDSSGKLYCADNTNNAIIKIDPINSTKSTIVSGLNHPCSLAFDSNGNLYCSNNGNNTIIKILM